MRRQQEELRAELTARVEALTAQLKQRGDELQRQTERLADIEAALAQTRAELDDREADMTALRVELERHQAELAAIYATRLFRYAAPFRRVYERVRRSAPPRL